LNNCTDTSEEKVYTAPTVSFDIWKEEKLSTLIKIIEDKLTLTTNPVVVVLEIGHFKLPKEDENISWAKQNIEFSESLCEKIVQKYKQKVKIIPTMLINNLEGDELESKTQEILKYLLNNNKYITEKSLKLLSERNLKNRAYKALKNNPALSDSFIHIDGKAFFKDKEYEHDLAAGFVGDDGDIIPRCGLILTSFMDKVTEFALQRMHQNENIDILFVSFSQESFEYKRVKLGVDIYTSTHNKANITPIISHWGYPIDTCLISHRDADSKKWHDIEG